MVQTLVTQVAAMTTSEAAIPDLVPHIVAEAAEGAAYAALPSPKGSVLNAVTSTIGDLNARFSQVSHIRNDPSHVGAAVAGGDPAQAHKQNNFVYVCYGF